MLIHFFQFQPLWTVVFSLLLFQEAVTQASGVQVGTLQKLMDYVRRGKLVRGLMSGGETVDTHLWSSAIGQTEMAI